MAETMPNMQGVHHPMMDATMYQHDTTKDVRSRPEYHVRSSAVTGTRIQPEMTAHEIDQRRRDEAPGMTVPQLKSWVRRFEEDRRARGIPEQGVPMMDIITRTRTAA